MGMRAALCRRIRRTLGNIHPIGLHGQPCLGERPGNTLSIISLAASGIQQNAAGSAIAHCRLFQRLEQRRIVTGIQKTLSGTHHDRIVSRILGVLAVCRQQVHIAAFRHIETMSLGTAPGSSPMLHERTAHRTFPNTHAFSSPMKIFAGSSPALAVTCAAGNASRSRCARISAAKRSVP